MVKLLSKNKRQSVWTSEDKFFVISTSLDNNEVMIFNSNSSGEITDWSEVYFAYEDVNNHDLHAELFIKDREYYNIRCNSPFKVQEENP